MVLLGALPEELKKRRVVVLTDTDPEANGPLRLRLRPQGFGLVLIDVDGTVAHRRPLPTSVRELANFIDRMPSRRLRPARSGRKRCAGDILAIDVRARPP